MKVLDQLVQQETANIELIKALEAENVKIRAAISAINALDGGSASDAIVNKLNVNEAVIEAVRNGRKSPLTILSFIKNELGMDTTINSVRSRVSTLGSEGKIAKVPGGWGPTRNE